MTPIDFVVFDGDSSPNTPVHEVAEAMTKNLAVVGPKGEMQVLSYYYCNKNKCMILEVEA